MPRMLRSFMKRRPSPPKEPVANSRSRSHRVSPCDSISRSGWLRWLVLQRVGVGHHVAAHAVGVDQLEDAGLLGDVVVVAGDDVLGPADRLVGDAQRPEDLVVEAVLAEQQLVHARAGTRRTARPG